MNSVLNCIGSVDVRYALLTFLYYFFMPVKIIDNLYAFVFFKFRYISPTPWTT